MSSTDVEDTTSIQNADEQQEQEQQQQQQQDVELIAAMMASSSLNARKQAAKATKEAESHIDLVRLIDVYFTTLNVYSDSVSTRLVVQSMGHALRRPMDAAQRATVVEHFMRKLTMAIKTLKPSLHAKMVPHHTLFEWTLVLVSSNVAAFTDDASLLSSLLALQSQLLSTLSASQLIRAQSRFNTLIKEDKPLLAIYQTNVRSNDNPQMVILAGFTLAATGKKAMDETTKQAYLNYYNKAVLSSTTPFSLDKHMLFTPLFKSLDINDFTTVLLPTLSRFIKRSQEDITAIMALMFENFSIDLSSLAKTQIVPMLMPVLQIATLDKKLIKRIFGLVALNTKDGKVLTSVFDDILKPLATPGNLAAKLNSLCALKALAVAPHAAADRAAMAKVVLTPIATYMEKELTKANRIKAFNTFSSWLPAHEGPMPDNLIKVITNSLKSDEDIIKASTIDALASSLGVAVEKGHEKKIAQIVAFADTVGAIIKGIKNPATCDTASTTAALNFQLRLASTPSIGDKLRSDKTFVANFYTGTSFVHQTSFYSRVTKPDRFVRLVASIARSIPTFTPKASERAIYSTLVGLLLHSSWPIRRAANEAIASLHGSMPTLANSLFTEFARLYANGTPKVQLSQDIVATALKRTLSPSLSESHLTTLSVLAFHPTIGNAWRACTAIIGKPETAILSGQQARDIVAHLFSTGLLNRKDESCAAAAHDALVAFAHSGLSSVVEAALPLFMNSMNPLPLTSFTPLQLAILNTPADTLYVDPSAQTVETPDTSAARRGKAPKKKTAEEERDEEHKRRIAEKKKKESGEDERLEKERLRAIAAQADVRADVNVTIAIYGRILNTLIDMVLAKPTLLGEHISPVFLHLIDLLRVGYTHDNALRAYKVFALCIPTRVGVDQYQSCIYTYLISNIYATPILSDPAILGGLQRTLSSLREKSTQVALPGCTFAYFWPLVKNGLEKGVSFTLQELAMEVIERHTAQGPPYPRGSMIAALIGVVATSSRLEGPARSAIFQIIGGLEESDVEALMTGLVSQHHQVRLICLQALDKIPALSNPSSSFVWTESYIGRLWFIRHDEPATAAIADKLWAASGVALPTGLTYLDALQDSTYTSHADVRRINTTALKAAAAAEPSNIRPSIELLIEKFERNIPGDIKDSRQLTITRQSIAAAAAGVGAAITSSDDLSRLFEWVIHTGLTDGKEEVRQEFINAGMYMVGELGITMPSELLSIFEAVLDRPDSGSSDEDSMRASLVVFMGALAKHMPADSPKVILIIDKLVAALATPSESVQVAVARCITQLLNHFKKQGERLIPILLNNVRMGADYATRRGNALGLAGAVKGLGISSLKTYDIVSQLTSFVEDKKHPASRQGSLFAFECLCNMLGRVFEPYVIQIIPKLLVCFGDSAADVRTATSEASKAIMSQLSGHGVKIVLPALLNKLDDRQWRTKEGSIELLGSMAYCAPKQLSTCLPSIVPKLTYVLNDTHIKVQEAAKEALSHIGSVIRNPEIQIHVPLILKTYDDPDVYNRELLEALLNTSYIHTIDAASLSLIMPILERTLKERGSEIKKMTCQIVGNLCSLTESKELIPYLNVIMPTLQNVLLDPIPEVRAICARALGLLVRGMGEDNFPNLVPWLLEMVKSEAGPVERSGAAQGLSEVLASLDISRFNTLIGELLAMSSSPRPHVREGVMSMFIYTPVAFGEAFLPYLPRVLPQVLKGLADDYDPVREVCMRCGQSIVNQFAVSGIEVIVPSLERVLFHENWRIRLSTIQLFGDLLFKLGGAAPDSSGNPNAVEADDDECASNTKADIYNLLGKERLDRILSSLYMMRFDTNSSVRQKVLLIWKYVVNNTPKTLREILPTLIEMVIGSIGSSNVDKRSVAARSLGDVVSKLGDRILPEILPILERGLTGDDETRQGVCIGLTEVISSARALLLPYLPSVVQCISHAIIDPLIDVREAAARAFDQLYSTFGQKASNEILPPLIAQLDSSNAKNASNALDGLRQIVRLKSNIVLPYIVPKLLVRPIVTSNVAALAALAQDAGVGVIPHIDTIVPALIEAFTNPSATNGPAIKAAAVTICRSAEQEGLEELIPLIIEQTELPIPTTRQGACELLSEIITGSQLDIEDYVDDLILALLALFNDPERTVQVAANAALGAITKTVKKDNLNFLNSVQNGIERLSGEVDETGTVPAFCLPKGLASVLPLLLNGLRYGAADQRELATNTLHTVISLTSQEGVKSSVMEITGPLILTIGDKFPWGVKAAILQTLALLITKCPASMKIFLHQLQPTFIKALSDPHKTVRNNAASALGLLMTLSPSVDQLVNSLVTGISTSDATTQEVKMRALLSIFEKKPKIDQANLDKAIAPIVEFLLSQSDEHRSLAAQVVGASSKCFSSSDALNSFVKTTFLSPSGAALIRYGKSLGLGECIKHAGAAILSGPHVASIMTTCQSDLKDEKAPIRESSALVAEYILLVAPQHAADLLPGVCALISDQASQVAINALIIIKRFCKAQPTVSRNFLSLIVPPTMNRLRERTNLPLKLASERALVHSLQIFKESVVMDDYLKTVTDAALSTSIVDYHKRVLIKLTPESDSEQ
eukprot:gene18804-22495_t